MEDKSIYYVQSVKKNRLFKIYKGMIARCCDEKHMFYNRYGGRGIKICNEWLNDFNKFADWSLDNGFKNQSNIERAKMLSIDRINNNGNYEPSNCQWITLRENARKDRVGVPLNEEHRQKVIKALIGRKQSEETKRKRIETLKGIPHSKEWVEKSALKHRKKVVCITTGEVFESIREAQKKYHIYDGDISKCCKGKVKSAGKLPDGTKLVWQYYNDYLNKSE